MKNLFLILVCLIFTNAVLAETVDYKRVYAKLEPADFSYIHGIDPDQYYDMKNQAWSPYPLFRLNSTIYFKTIALEPGYYLLTPRSHQGKWFVLFKENGKVKYIIPCYNRDIVPETFYKENLPQAKLTPSQKIHIGFVDFMGKHFSTSKRKNAPQSYLELEDLDNDFVSIIIYYGSFRYHLLFRSGI